MKIQNNFKFEETDKERWKKCADKKTRGNLSLWIEMCLNKEADEFLGKKRCELDDDSLTKD